MNKTLSIIIPTLICLTFLFAEVIQINKNSYNHQEVQKHVHTSYWLTHVS